MRVFHSGALCGIADFDGAAGVGHLHLVWRGPLGVTDTQVRHSIVSEPSMLFFPRPGAHRLAGGEREGAELVCALIDFGAGDESPLLRGPQAPLSVPQAQLPGLDLAKQLLFSEAQASCCGHGAVVDRLSEVLVIQLLRHAMAHRLVDGGMMAGQADARLAKVITALHAAALGRRLAAARTCVVRKLERQRGRRLLCGLVRERPSSGGVAGATSTTTPDIGMDLSVLGSTCRMPGRAGTPSVPSAAAALPGESCSVVRLGQKGQWWCACRSRRSVPPAAGDVQRVRVRTDSSGAAACWRAQCAHAIKSTMASNKASGIGLSTSILQSRAKRNGVRTETRSKDHILPIRQCLPELTLLAERVPRPYRLPPTRNDQLDSSVRVSTPDQSFALTWTVDKVQSTSSSDRC